MKAIDKLITIPFLFAIMLSVLVFSGCQSETEEIIDPPAQEVIKPGSNVADLMRRTALRDGSEDNILDGSSCLSVVLPVTVIANGLEIIVDSEDDFVTLEKIFDELDNDEDIIEISFPVTVVLSDHSEIVVNDQQELTQLAINCTEGGDDEDIECVDFVYPITINIYDSNKQIADVIILNNDEELHKFFDDLEDGDLVSFSFPITVVLSDGQKIEIDDNSELEDIIDNVKDDCDEDDDNDFNDDDADDTELVNVLMAGDWEITYFFDETDQTSDFSGFVFTFFADRTAKAVKDPATTNGQWETNGDDGTLEIELDFGEIPPLDELKEDWDVAEFSNTVIKLRDIGEGEVSTDSLVFERI